MKTSTAIASNSGIARAQLVEIAVSIKAAKRDVTRRLADLANRHGVKKSSLYRWLSLVQTAPRDQWSDLLIDGRGVGKARRPECRAEIPAAVWSEYKSNYLQLEQTTEAACYRAARRTARRLGLVIPSPATFSRRLREEVPHLVRVAGRQGEIALLAALGCQQRDVSGLTAGEFVNADGYRHNCFVISPDGEIYRPKSWVWQDMRSRRILSWHTDKSEHKDAVRLSFLHLCKEFGVPRHIALDNTRAAANKWLSGGLPGRKRFKSSEEEIDGVFKGLDIKVHWTSINRAENGRSMGHGQAKPVERAFRDFDELDRRFEGAYTGRSTVAKPANYGATAVPEAIFKAELKAFIAEFNARDGRRSHVFEGYKGERSYDALWQATYQPDRLVALTEERELQLLLAAESRRVRPDGTIQLSADRGADLPRNLYGAEFLYGWIGKRLIVRFDPTDLHAPIHCFQPDGRHIGKAECILAVGALDTNGAREINRYRKRQTKAVRAQLLAHRGEVDAKHRALIVPQRRASAGKLAAKGSVPQINTPVIPSQSKTLEKLTDYYSTKEETLQ